MKRIFITDKGYEVLDHVQHVANDLDALLFDDVADDELAAAADVMMKVKNNVRSALKNVPVVIPLGLPKAARPHNARAQR